MRPISTNLLGSMELGDYGLTRGTCFVARRLEVVVVAGLLWISRCMYDNNTAAAAPTWHDVCMYQVYHMLLLSTAAIILRHTMSCHSPGCGERASPRHRILPRPLPPLHSQIRAHSNKVSLGPACRASPLHPLLFLSFLASNRKANFPLSLKQSFLEYMNSRLCGFVFFFPRRSAVNQGRTRRAATFGNSCCPLTRLILVLQRVAAPLSWNKEAQDGREQGRSHAGSFGR